MAGTVGDGSYQSHNRVSRRCQSAARNTPAEHSRRPAAAISVEWRTRSSDRAERVWLADSANARCRLDRHATIHGELAVGGLFFPVRGGVRRHSGGRDIVVVVAAAAWPDTAFRDGISRRNAARDVSDRPSDAAEQQTPCLLGHRRHADLQPADWTSRRHQGAERRNLDMGVSRDALMLVSGTPHGA